MDVHIRPATAADLPALHGLVAELARYVGESASLATVVADYERDFAAGFFRALVAEDREAGRVVVGMALYYFAYSTWKGRMIYLEDFVLEPAYRRRGIGQQLWDALKEQGRANGCKLLKWQIAENNTEALKFYRAQEADITGSWIDGKLYL